MGVASLAEMEEGAALDPFLRAGCSGEEGGSSLPAPLLAAGLCVKQECCRNGEKKNLWTSGRNAVSKPALCYRELSMLGWRKSKNCLGWKNAVFYISDECRMPQWTIKSPFQKHWPKFVYCVTPLQSSRVTAGKNLACCLHRFNALWTILLIVFKIILCTEML